MSIEPAIGLPHGRPLTRADLDLLPEDGRRYELIDGTLIVSPSPRHRHQRALLRLALLLEAAAPRGYEVLTAPFDVILADDTVLIPDLTVHPVEHIAEDGIHGAPLIAVEILSPSTRRYDLLLKKDRYRGSGGPHYWVVDPSAEHPSITCWTLRDGEYAETASAHGGESAVIDEPFPLTIVPADLVAAPGL